MTVSPKRLGVAVRQTRKAQGFTTATAFAEACGLTSRLINDLETGRRLVSPSSLARVEQVLGWEPGKATRLADDALLPPAPTRLDEINSLRATVRDLDAARERVQTMLDALLDSDA